MKSLSQKAIYFIPVGAEFGLAPETIYVVYSPLRSKAFLISGAQKERVARQIENAENDATSKFHTLFAETRRAAMEAHEPSPRECCNLTILPNQCCNFSCAYCYSKKGRSSQRLDLGKIKAAIDFLLESTTAPKRKFRVLYLGGGEPLMSWETVAESVEYLRKRAREKNCLRNLSVSISTNGSLLTEEIVRRLKELDVSTQVSFEILKDVQNSQRGFFDIVDEKLRLALSKGLPVSVHVVVTSANLDRMTETLETAKRNYPSLKRVSMEPVADTESFSAEAGDKDFYEKFRRNFLACEKIAEDAGIELVSAHTKLLSTTRTLYCGSQLILSPDGSLGACESVSAPNEAHFEHFRFGEIGDDGEVRIDGEAFTRTHPAHMNYPNGGCRDCWAKWNCGGGCTHKFLSLPREQITRHCEMTKGLLLSALVKKIKDESRKSGIDLEKAIAAMKLQ